MCPFRCRELDGTIYLLRKDVCCQLDTLFGGRCFQISCWLNVLSFCSNICRFAASRSPNGCTATARKSSQGLVQATKYGVHPDGKRKEHAFSFHPGTKTFPRSPFTSHLFGQKGGSHGLRGWPDKGAPRFFSSCVGRRARRRQEESPTKVFVTNRPVPFLPFPLPHPQKSLPVNSLPALETGSDEPATTQLTARVQGGRPGRQYLCYV